MSALHQPFYKELVRTVTRKPGRFLALLAIVALGAGFYAGLRMTAPDMKASIDAYLDNAHSYDVRVVGTMGLSDTDRDALLALDEVDEVMLAYEVDALGTVNDATYTVRVHSFPAALAAGGTAHAEGGPDQAYLNRVELVEGRWPEQEGECVVSADRVAGANARVGAQIVLNEGTVDLRDALKTQTYTIVGSVHAPYYISSASIDSSSLGSGVVQQFLYVREEDFADSYPYTEAFVTVRGARDLAYGSSAYDEAIDQAKDAISAIADERCEARLDEITDKMMKNALTYDGLLDLLEYRLARTQAQIDDPERPEWLVMGRDKNPGTISFVNDADRVDHIASIFPLIFFLVAALVALTTMTRMVDEDRLLVGTFKALGYSRGRITSKYLLYALAAAGVGSAIGIAVLARLLPGVIMNAYAIMYYVPTAPLAIDWPIALLSAGASIAITLAATWFSITATLREKPAALLRPRAPKIGKRILLERVGPLWRRLSFTWKVTCRNIFRYKKRFIMTVIGIAGCTALLLTGLGLHDAINDIIDVQYGELVHHNAVISIDKRISAAERAEFDAILADSGLITQHTDGFSETMLASGPRAQDKRIDLVVPFDPQEFATMKTMRTRVGHEPVELSGGMAALNEKMAVELGLSVGDEITIHEQDAMGNATSVEYRFTVGALVENYIYNYLYVDAETYAEVVGHAPVRTAVYVNVAGGEEQRAALDEKLRALDGVRTITYNDEVLDTYRTMLRSIDLIVVVLVVSAAALAFIVLYNLTNINIEERIREIATLKVLGFTRRETAVYIFREIALLALIGAAIGMFLGVTLESFVVTTAEVDQVMFGRAIHPPSFVASYLLTLVFAAISCALMLPKLAHIDMVMSLKSNE